MCTVLIAVLISQTTLFVTGMNENVVLALNGTKNLKPNIVLVMTDSFDGRLTIDPGNKVVQLPYATYMREHGAVFLNAYTNSPICCPSRAAMWSGKFIHLTESWNNYKCLDENYTTWMDLLQRDGYYTKKLGKQDYISGGHSVSNRVEAWIRDSELLLRQEGRPVTNLTGNASTVRVMSKDWSTIDRATQWIRETAPGLTQPFSLYIGLNLPHPYQTEGLGENAGGSTFQTSPYWLKKVNGDLITVPKWLPLSKMHPVDYYSTYTKNCSGLFTEQEIKDIRGFYYAMCAEADAMLGKILLALQESGLESSTVLLFSSDHGELAMEHRQFYKMSMYEGSVHIPLLATGPGITPKVQQPQPVSLVDLYPTLLELAGIPLPGRVSGHSLLPLLSQAATPGGSLHPPWVLSEFHGCDVNASAYMLRTEQWKYIAYADGHSVAPQLFDLSSDREELYDISTKQPEVTQRLDGLLRSILDYPAVSRTVQLYNKRQFIAWRKSLGDNYTSVIASLRWHLDWQQDPESNEDTIDRWILGAVQ